jgi:Tfp pilus assembly protein FimT
MRNRGFTFIELMIVTGLIMTVLGLSFPVLKNTFSALSLSNYAHTLAQRMVFLRETAIRNNTPCSMGIDTTAQTVILASTEHDKTVVLSQRPIPPAITIASNAPTIYFYPNGSVTDARITITDNTGKRTAWYEIVTYFATGRVSINEKT